MKQHLIHWLECHFGQLFILYLATVMIVVMIGLVLWPWLTLTVMGILGLVAIALFTVLNLEANYHSKRVNSH
ncbi:hypothetical protein LMC02_09825 [Limosilactobacillus reuteri]|uniref:hypothetical protein n=1 Tax=Limosilactobacillus reuteri TaxID=1598 RepID=UPI001E308EFC|nr:hypothetical protein [Limosilactobacillus reuteri]MCC4500285.1 hypothetical protein [Limosilactobacillus reuteri]MCC4500610.1 hypothetical protein [Limosilactobacillus reuteri]